jgi:hypothetical protein
MLEIKTTTVDLFPYGGKYKVLVSDWEKCNRLNKLFKAYRGYTFKEGDEGIFVFEKKYLINVRAILDI